MKTILFALVMILVFAACGDTAESELPIADPSSTGAPSDEGTCLAGEPDCEDTFPDSGEPTEPPAPGVSVTDVVSTNIDGGFAITGFYFANDSGVRLCEALAESFPPQCGGDSIPFDNTAGADLEPLTIEQGITWSDQPVLVVGRVIDGVFVAD